MNGQTRRLPRTARFAAMLAVLTGAASGAFASETRVSLRLLPDKTYEVSGDFIVDASTATIWGVLTDYNHIPAFVSSMRSSRVRQDRGDGSLLVEQKAVGDMFFFSKTMRILLEVRRRPDELRFTDVGGQDFRVYDGTWEARPTSDGVGVSYRLRVEPNFLAPAFILSRAVKRGARNLLDQVRAEILRRELAK